jgi:AMMECR1 domain-containing protein
VTEFDLGSAVLRIARSAIAEKLGVGALDPMSHARLEQPSATFVTLRVVGELRGCVGSLHAVRTLREDVRTNAVAAAFRDPRFAPLAASELASTSLKSRCCRSMSASKSPPRRSFSRVFARGSMG